MRGSTPEADRSGQQHHGFPTVEKLRKSCSYLGVSFETPELCQRFRMRSLAGVQTSHESEACCKERRRPQREPVILLMRMKEWKMFL
jgi:hypothetical protein